MYILEGNIGAGKSTFIKVVQAHCSNLLGDFEPLNEWYRHVEGQSLLANFYKNPHRWAYAMETFAMFCRVQEHTKEQIVAKTSAYPRLVERSIYSGHYCFALNSYRNGFMSQLEWTMYNEWFNFLIPGNCVPPRGFIYLRVDPLIAFERVYKRQRAGEEGIPLNYLEQIHACHEEFLLEQRAILPELKQVPVLVLDGALDFEQNPTHARYLLSQVTEFIAATESQQNTNSLVFKTESLPEEKEHGLLFQK